MLEFTDRFAFPVCLSNTFSKLCNCCWCYFAFGILIPLRAVYGSCICSCLTTLSTQFISLWMSLKSRQEIGQPRFMSFYFWHITLENFRFRIIYSLSYSRMQFYRNYAIETSNTMIIASHNGNNSLYIQWRIQDFPKEGAPTPQGGANI